jgi:parallel beta-helix repeat protein
MKRINAKQYFVCTVLGLILTSSIATAQPSGGPYGPTPLKYELPKITGKIYYVSPDGSDQQSGETLDKPTSIGSALSRVVTGDAIIMRGGTYRTGYLTFNQGITIQPYADEQPVFKGTSVADKWEKLENGLWKTSWPTLFPAKPSGWWQPEKNKGTPLHRFNNDMVFVDGKFLQSAGSQAEVKADTYYIDYNDKSVYIGVDPAKKLIEITAFDLALTRTPESCHGKVSDKKGPTIRGITFTQYAYRAFEFQGTVAQGLTTESKIGKDVTGTTIENCTLSFCSRAAAYFKGDKLTIKNCLISDTSTEGIFIISSADVLLEKNIFRRNNIEKLDEYFPAGVKIFNQCYRAVCKDNYITDQPNSNGVWFDVGNVDGVFIDNIVANVGSLRRKFAKETFMPSDNGLFFEISKGAICAGNVFINCDHGIFVLNSSNARIYNNTFINSMACIGRTDRNPANDHFNWHSGTGPDVNERDGHVFVNNLMVADNDINRPMLGFSQPRILCKTLTNPQVKQLDYNVFVRKGPAYREQILWSPSPKPSCQEPFVSPEDMHNAFPEFSGNSRDLVNYTGPLFKDSSKGDYHLLNSFEAAKTGTQLPADISKLLGLPSDTAFVGAYPPTL